MNRWFVSPYLRYSHSKPGHGDTDQECFTELNKDKSVGVVLGRQVFAGKGSMVHFDFFAGPQAGYRHSREKLVLTDPRQIFEKNSRKFTWTLRIGVSMGISAFRKQENK